MKNIAIIGASYLQLPLIKKAKEMGYTTHVFAWAANDVGEYEADFFYPISIRDVEAITEKCREIGICGICSIATDLGNYTVNYVANKIGLPGNSMECTRKSTNKYLMRQAFCENNIPSPNYIVVDEDTDLRDINISYPLIVKPTDRSGSRGVTKIDEESELIVAVSKALNESFERKAVVEEFLEGKEYSVEGISFQGVHSILAVTEKHTTGSPNFIEIAHRQPADLDEKTYLNIASVIRCALDSLEITNSATHSEIMIDDDGNINIVEIASRMGGDCIGSDLVYLSTGIDFLKATIQLACGEKPDITSSNKGIHCEARFILTRNDLEEFNRIRENTPEKIIRVVDDKHFDLIGKTTNSSNRAGCYILCEDPI